MADPRNTLRNLLLVRFHHYTSPVVESRLKEGAHHFSFGVLWMVQLYKNQIKTDVKKSYLPSKMHL